MFVELTPAIVKGGMIAMGAIFFLTFAIGAVLNCRGKDESMAVMKISLIPFLAFVFFLVNAI